MHPERHKNCLSADESGIDIVLLAHWISLRAGETPENTEVWGLSKAIGLRCPKPRLRTKL